MMKFRALIDWQGNDRILQCFSKSLEEAKDWIGNEMSRYREKPGIKGSISEMVERRIMECDILRQEDEVLIVGKGEREAEVLKKCPK